MILTPECISPTTNSPRAKCEGKQRPAIDRLRGGSGLDEGTCVQVLHVGPYDDEGPALDHLHHEFVPRAGCG